MSKKLKDIDYPRLILGLLLMAAGWALLTK